jgi:integrase
MGLTALRVRSDPEHTWECRIKDSERRVLPLTCEVADLLKEPLAGQTTLHPYVFISASRCRRIQERRQCNKWTPANGRCPVDNFGRGFRAVLRQAGIESGGFHDLRRTCLSRRLANGLTEYGVMKLAGRSEFSTTHRFYLAV